MLYAQGVVFEKSVMQYITKLINKCSQHRLKQTIVALFHHRIIIIIILIITPVYYYNTGFVV